MLRNVAFMVASVGAMPEGDKETAGRSVRRLQPHVEKKPHNLTKFYTTLMTHGYIELLE